MQKVPFTVKADLDLGTRITPYIVDKSADVTICEGTVPQSISDPTTTGVAFSINSDQMLLTIPTGVRFLIEGGERIFYERNGRSDREVLLFLLGSAWGALCYQRSLLPLHASAVLKEGQVHAFTGPSGAGKSTLSAALADRGHRFFTDDVLIIDPENLDRDARCFTGQKDLKLWKDALKLTGAHKLGAVRDDENFNKFFAAPANSADISSGRLANLFILKNENSRRNAATPFEIKLLSGAESLKQLRDSVYRPRFANAIWGRARLYQILAKLIANVDVHTFDRPLVKKYFDEGIGIADQWINNWQATEKTAEVNSAMS